MAKQQRNNKSKNAKKSQRKNPKQNKTKRKTPTKTIVIGKIYADWCIHCKMLNPEWTKMKKLIKQNTGRSLKNVKFEIHEMGDTKENRAKNIQVHDLVNDFNEKHFPKMDKQVYIDGYPTIFKIQNKRIEYYNGDKNAAVLYDWFTKK